MRKRVFCYLTHFKKLARKARFTLVNRVILKLHKVEFASFRINGFIWIRNAGELVIGDNFMCNSGKRYNPIGDNVRVGGGCKIWDTDFHSTNPFSRISEHDYDVRASSILIDSRAFIGGGSIILKGVSIGENSIVAAGSVVTKNIPSNEIWGGNPAKYIRKLRDDELVPRNMDE